MRPDLDSNDVMSALEDLRRRWDTLDWKPAITSSYTGPLSGFNGTYESGIFFSMQHHSSGTRIVWLDMTDFTHRSVDLPYWDQPTCFATDPGQDLLVWTEFRGDRFVFPFSVHPTYLGQPVSTSGTTQNGRPIYTSRTSPRRELIQMHASEASSWMYPNWTGMP